MKQKSISILGGGIAGLATAIALNRTGFSATVYEASAELRPVGAGLGLGANAMMAFEQLGIKTEISRRGRQLPSFTIYDQSGRKIMKTDHAALSKGSNDRNFSIHRADLHECLLHHLKSGQLVLGKRLKHASLDKDPLCLTFEDGTQVNTDFLIVADGIHSFIRKELLPDAITRYAGYTCWRAVIDNNELQLEESSETWGKNGRFGIVPLANNKIYWFACLNRPRQDAEAAQYEISDLHKFFRNYHQPIPQIIAQTRQEHLIWNDIIDLKPIERFAFKCVLLIGDAAHATTPNMGQGACQAIEDAVTLGQCLADATTIETAFADFEKKAEANRLDYKYLMEHWSHGTIGKPFLNFGAKCHIPIDAAFFKCQTTGQTESGRF